MLVLCRRVSESLYIGEEVTVTVLAVKGNQVRFGIAAPRDVPVDREEVWARKQEQQGSAEAVSAEERVPVSAAPPIARRKRHRPRAARASLQPLNAKST
jgi:carbon storage regulator